MKSTRRRKWGRKQRKKTQQRTRSQPRPIDTTGKETVAMPKLGHQVESGTKSHPTLSWFRGVGAAAILIGGFGFMTTYFWWSVGCVYAGLAILFFDVLLVERLRKPWAAAFLILALAIAFSAGFVFTAAPIELSSGFTYSLHSPGALVAGVVWRPRFRELLVSLYNDSDLEYEKLDITLKPTAGVAGAAQLSSIPNCQFPDDPTTGVVHLDGGSRMGPVEQKTLGADGTWRTANLPGFTPHRRVLCPSLAPKTSLQLVLIVDSNDLRPKAEILVTGSYIARFRPRPISETIAIPFNR